MITFSDATRDRIIAAFDGPCVAYAALFIDGKEASERTRVEYDVIDDGRDQTRIRLKQEIAFDAPVSGTAMIAFFPTPVGGAWSFAFSDRAFDSVNKGETVRLVPWQ